MNEGRGVGALTSECSILNILRSHHATEYITLPCCLDNCLCLAHVPQCPVAVPIIPPVIPDVPTLPCTITIPHRPVSPLDLRAIPPHPLSWARPPYVYPNRGTTTLAVHHRQESS